MKRRPYGITGKKLLDATHRVNGTVEIDYQIYVSEGGMVAHCPKFELRTYSPDINKIRKDMEALINEKVSFVWEPWLVVTTTTFQNSEKMFDDTRNTIKLQIEVECVELTTREGVKYQRHPGSTSIVKNWPEAHGRQAGSRYGGSTSGDDYCVRALIRDTPEIRAALERLQTSVDAISAQLMLLLGQENIELALGRLLAAPPGVLALMTPSAEET